MQVCVLLIWVSQRNYQWLLGLNHTLQKHSPKPHTTETQPPEPHTPEQRFLSDSISVGGCPLSGAAAHLATPRVRAAAPVLILVPSGASEVGSVPKTPAGGAPGSLTALHKRSPETAGPAKACRSFGRGDPRSRRAPAPRSSNRGFLGTACASARQSFARTILHARTVSPPRRRVMWFLFRDSRQWKQSRCFGC